MLAPDDLNLHERAVLRMMFEQSSARRTMLGPRPDAHRDTRYLYVLSERLESQAYDRLIERGYVRLVALKGNYSAEYELTEVGRDVALEVSYGA